MCIVCERIYIYMDHACFMQSQRAPRHVAVVLNGWHDSACMRMLSSTLFYGASG